MRNRPQDRVFVKSPGHRRVFGRPVLRFSGNKASKRTATRLPSLVRGQRERAKATLSAVRTTIVCTVPWCASRLMRSGNSPVIRASCFWVLPRSLSNGSRFETNTYDDSVFDFVDNMRIGELSRATIIGKVIKGGVGRKQRSALSVPF
jgi:hypothetical protein